MKKLVITLSILTFGLFSSSALLSESPNFDKIRYIAQKDDIGFIISTYTGEPNNPNFIVICPELHLPGQSRVETSLFLLRLKDLLEVREFFLEGYTFEKSREASFEWPTNPVFRKEFRPHAIKYYTSKLTKNSEEIFFNPIEYLSLVRADIYVRPTEVRNEHDIESVEITQDDLAEGLIGIENREDTKNLIAAFKEKNFYSEKLDFTSSGESTDRIIEILRRQPNPPEKLISKLEQDSKWLKAVDLRSLTMVKSILNHRNQSSSKSAALLIGAAHLRITTTLLRNQKINYAVFWPKGIDNKFFQMWMPESQSLGMRPQLAAKASAASEIELSFVQQKLGREADLFSTRSFIREDINKFLGYVQTKTYLDNREIIVAENNKEIRWESTILPLIGEEWIRQTTEEWEKEKLRIDFLNRYTHSGIELKYVRTPGTLEYARKILRSKQIEKYIQAYNLDSIALLILINRDFEEKYPTRIENLRRDINVYIENLRKKEQFKNKDIFMEFQSVSREIRLTLKKWSNRSIRNVA